MLNRLFNSSTSILLNKSMDVATLRNDVIANNIANVTTPNFKRQEVIFQEKLQNVINNHHETLTMKVTNNRHITIKSKLDLDPEIREISETSFRNDGNNVDIDVESAKLSQNKIYYDALAQSMNNEIKLLRLAISGRG